MMTSSNPSSDNEKRQERRRRREMRRFYENKPVAGSLLFLSIATVGVSIVAGHHHSGWIITGAIAAALYSGSVLMAKPTWWQKSTDEVPTHPPAVTIAPSSIIWRVAAYVAAAVLGFASLPAMWHEYRDRVWNGFDRGGGWPTVLAAVLLVLAAIAILSRKKPVGTSPWPDAVACACGAAMLIASVAGTGTDDMYAGRKMALLAGVIAFTASIVALRTWRGDEIYGRAVAAGVTGLAGAAVLAGSFMSWGSGGGFLVNYVPGTTAGGFDGRFSMFAGAGIVALSMVALLNTRFEPHREDWQLRFLYPVLVLGLIALFAVLAGDAGRTSHPGRALTGLAAAATLAGWAVAPPERSTMDLPTETPPQNVG